VYTSGISGCVEGDFIAMGGSTSTPVCSTACVQGLARIQDAILKSCAGVAVGETSIIGAFQNGLGLRALCPGVTVTTRSPSTAPLTTTQVAVETSTEPAATTAPSRTSLSTANTSSTSKTEGTPSSSTPSAGSAVDPSATASTLPSSTVAARSSTDAKSSTAGPNPSQAANRQLSNAESGGGSPFDVVAVGSASQRTVLGGTASLLVATVVLLVAWLS